MKNIKEIIGITIIAIIFGSFTSCKSGDGTQNAKDALSSFLNDNDEIVAFGNANLNEILVKSDYKNIPKLGTLLNSEMSTLETMIDFNTPMYYALEGPFSEDGSPEATYVFLQVKDDQLFVDELTKRGFDVIEKKNFKYTEDGDFSLGLIENIAVVITKKGDYDAEKSINKAFKSIKGDVSGGKIDEILAIEGDVVLGMNVSSLYNTSNTNLSNLSKEKKKELEELVKDSYIQTVFKFEEGAAIVETKNFFSEKLSEKMFFNTDNSAPLLSNLGSGNPRLGITVNVDMHKMQDFINDYSPETMDELSKAMGPMVQTALMLSGKEGLAALFDGQLGLVMVGDPGENGAMIPDFNAYVGLTTKGKDLADMFGSMDLGFAQLTMQKSGLSMSSNPAFAINTKGKNLNLPTGCTDFGKSSISVFINLKGLDMDDFDLEGGQNVLKVVEYITFDYNNDGGRLYIKAKKGQENVLKQTMDVVIDEFASEISKVSI